MPRYVYQRSGGPLVYWAHGQAPSQSRAADARSLGALGCGGGCGCTSCGHKPVGDAYLKEPRGAVSRYVLGATPYLPGAPEPLTDDLMDPYETLQSGGKPTGSPIGVGTIVLGGLALALAWPHLKKMMG